MGLGSRLPAHGCHARHIRYHEVGISRSKGHVRFVSLVKQRDMPMASLLSADDGLATCGCLCVGVSHAALGSSDSHSSMAAVLMASSRYATMVATMVFERPQGGVGMRYQNVAASLRAQGRSRGGATCRCV